MKKVVLFAALIAVLAGYLGWRVFPISKTYHQAAAPVTAEPSVTITPSTIVQGDPVLVIVENADIREIMSFTWQGKAVPLFIYKGKPSALLAIDLKKPTGDYPITLRLANGTDIKKSVIVGKRPIVTAPLGIPTKLGGNTPEAAQNLVSTLAEENAILASVRSGDTMLWSNPFTFPVKDPVVTDVYGYTRATVNTSISHKGTDFRATVGTPVYAMNSGRVAMVREFRNYGKTIIIDHGLGLQTLYMHLSETQVIEGERVAKGEVIGKSGMTGYAESPHLHISVKVGGISIDPLKFLELFK